MELHKFGWIPDTEDVRDYYYSLSDQSGSEELPRYAHCRRGLPAAYDQEGLNTAVPAAIADALAVERSRCGLPALVPSRLYTYWYARFREAAGASLSDNGCSIRDCLKALKREGLCRENMWPYSHDMVNVKPGPYAYAAAERPGIASYERVPYDLATIKHVINSGHAVICGTLMYPGYDSLECECTGDIPMPESKDVPIGAHCVLLIGYDDSLQCFVFRNSRGPQWGWIGLGRMPYDYATLETTDLWIINCK